MPNYNIFDGTKCFQLWSVDPTVVGNWVDGELVPKYDAVEKTNERIPNLTYDSETLTFRAKTQEELLAEREEAQAAAEIARIAALPDDAKELRDILITYGVDPNSSRSELLDALAIIELPEADKLELKEHIIELWLSCATQGIKRGDL